MTDSVVYRQVGFPVFQNKVYATRELAMRAVAGDVELVQSAESGLIYNNKFDPKRLDYGQDYQNEQACSPVFQKHLEHVLDIVRGSVTADQVGIEVGCGKGYFLEMLVCAGFSVTGYDPAYEGYSSHVKREYFGQSPINARPDYVILRHVLEHINDPWTFLAMLSANSKSGTLIYIEVPCFDWILKNNAFYDIFYEHVNYFTLSVLAEAFSRVIESGQIFGGQYIYLIADLSSFKTPSEYNGMRLSSLRIDGYLEALLAKKMNAFTSTYIWGAGAKGITFSNILTKKGVCVEAIVDINPAKQGRFSALSALPIIAPDSARSGLIGADVYVMNPLYLDEITAMVSDPEINWIPVT